MIFPLQPLFSRLFRRSAERVHSSKWMYGSKRRKWDFEQIAHSSSKKKADITSLPVLSEGNSFIHFTSHVIPQFFFLSCLRWRRRYNRQPSFLILVQPYIWSSFILLSIFVVVFFSVIKEAISSLDRSLSASFPCVFLFTQTLPHFLWLFVGWFLSCVILYCVHHHSIVI